MVLQELFDHAEGLGDFRVGDLFDRSVVGFGEDGCAAGWTCSVLGGFGSRVRNEPSCDRVIEDVLTFVVTQVRMLPRVEGGNA